MSGACDLGDHLIFFYLFENHFDSFDSKNTVNALANCVINNNVFLAFNLLYYFNTDLNEVCEDQEVKKKIIFCFLFLFYFILFYFILFYFSFIFIKDKTILELSQESSKELKSLIHDYHHDQLFKFERFPFYPKKLRENIEQFLIYLKMFCKNFKIRIPKPLAKLIIEKIFV